MPIDRTLTAPPLHSDVERSLIATLCMLYGLTLSEGRALVWLIKYDHASRAEIHSAIADGDPVTGIEIVRVVIWRLRGKLKRHDIQINTVHALGYRLAPDSRMRIRELLAAYGADVVAAATPASNAPPRPRKSEAA